MRIPSISLRARLTLYFVGIVVVPLLVAGIFVQVLTVRQARQQSDGRLAAAAPGVVAAVRQRAERASTATRLVAVQAFRAGGEPALEALRRRAGLDYLIVSRGGRGLAAIAAGRFRPGIAAPELVRDGPAAAAVAEGRVDIQGTPAGEVRGGLYLDLAFLDEFAVDAVLLSRGEPVAATLTPIPDVDTPSDGAFDAADDLRGLFVSLADAPASGIVLLTPRESSVAPALGLLLPGLVVAVLIGYALARLIARPVQRLVEGTIEIARGDLGRSVETEGRDEIARLGAAFNAMTENLRRYVRELRESRDELRRNLERLGETLSSTHDLDAMLEVILETAAVTVGAESGAVFLRQGRRRELRARVGRGIEDGTTRLRFGVGVAGQVAASQRPVLFPADGVATPEAPEPEAATAIAVPLSRAGQLIGALALYGRATGESFDDDDLSTLSSFASQASVAIENVYLHQETERLSITDDLTGTWNRRYLDLTLDKEVQRAERFGHPLSVLMLDIDHFKRINDQHGHRVGDEVLAGLARRVGRSIRSNIDTLARFGGEEFTIVLPETGGEGALTVAEKVRRVVAERPFGRGRTAVRITLSVGIATYPEDGRTGDELIRAADRALYRAKREGRDRVVVAGRG